MNIIKLIIAKAWVVGTSRNVELSNPAITYHASIPHMEVSFNCRPDLPFAYFIEGNCIVAKPTHPLGPPDEIVGHYEEMPIEALITGITQMLHLDQPAELRTEKQNRTDRMLEVLGNYSRLSHLSAVDVGQGRISNQVIVHYDDAQDATAVYVGIALSREDD